MKKTLFFAAAALAMLASCSQNDLEAPVVAQSQQSDAIEFGTYLGKAASSRGTAYVGDITTADLQASANGFGVIAFYTGKDNYPNSKDKPSAPYAESTLTANFMFNQHVTYVTDHWTYSPLKYWPNEVQSGDVDNNANADEATSTGTYGGKVSFFAYAPYMDTYGTTGIIKVNGQATYADAKSQAGNPKITYKMADDGKNVDLLWGTCPDAESYNIVPNTTQTGDYVWDGTEDSNKGAGKVNVNLTKQKTNATETSAEKVNFLFKHALAKVGGAGDGLQIQLDPDFGANFGDHASKPETVVTVNSITIAKKAGSDKKLEGTLDLATGHWSNTSDDNNFTFTIGDADLNTKIKEVAFSELATNPYWGTDAGNMLANGHTGVITTAENVYNGDVAPLLYFPGEIPAFTVTVDYYVRTKDPNLSQGYSQVRQVITKNVTFASAVEMNKRYKMLIKLGLTSVKFEATVDNWTDVEANTTDHTIVNVPLNVTD